MQFVCISKRSESKVEKLDTFLFFVRFRMEPVTELCSGPAELQRSRIILFRTSEEYSL